MSIREKPIVPSLIGKGCLLQNRNDQSCKVKFGVSDRLKTGKLFARRHLRKLGFLVEEEDWMCMEESSIDRIVSAGYFEGRSSGDSGISCKKPYRFF